MVSCGKQQEEPWSSSASDPKRKVLIWNCTSLSPPPSSLLFCPQFTTIKCAFLNRKLKKKVFPNWVLKECANICLECFAFCATSAQQTKEIQHLPHSLPPSFPLSPESPSKGRGKQRKRKRGRRRVWLNLCETFVIQLGTEPRAPRRREVLGAQRGFQTHRTKWSGSCLRSSPCSCGKAAEASREVSHHIPMEDRYSHHGSSCRDRAQNQHGARPDLDATQITKENLAFYTPLITHRVTKLSKHLLLGVLLFVCLTPTKEGGKRHEVPQGPHLTNT